MLTYLENLLLKKSKKKKVLKSALRSVCYRYVDTYLGNFLLQSPVLSNGIGFTDVSRRCKH